MESTSSCFEAEARRCIGEAPDIPDFERGGKLSGTRFTVYKGAGAGRRIRSIQRRRSGRRIRSIQRRRSRAPDPQHTEAPERGAGSHSDQLFLYLTGTHIFSR